MVNCMRAKKLQVKKEMLKVSDFGCRVCSSNPVLLSKFFPYAGRSDQLAYIYTGRVGRIVGQKLDTVEELEVAFVEEGSIFNLLSKSISATHLLAYLLYQNSRDRSPGKSA